MLPHYRPHPLLEGKLRLPLSVRLLKQMKREIPVDADARTAQLDTVLGVLLVISLIPGGLF